MTPFLALLLIPLLVTFISPMLERRVATWVSAVAFLIPMLSALYGLLTSHKGEELLIALPNPVGDFYLLYDSVSHAFGFTICLVSAMVAIYSLPYMRHRFEEIHAENTGSSTTSTQWRCSGSFTAGISSCSTSSSRSPCLRRLC
ncbi:MAG: hypothetical protein QW226_00960 [Archaeoglobaceae archaeon]